MKLLIAVIALSAGAGCVDPVDAPQYSDIELETLCGDDGYFVVWAHRDGTTYRDYDRGYCPNGTVCVAGFGEDPCQ